MEVGRLTTWITATPSSCQKSVRGDVVLSAPQSGGKLPLGHETLVANAYSRLFLRDGAKRYTSDNEDPVSTRFEMMNE